MPNLKGHITGSVLLFPAYYAVYYAVGWFLGDPYRPPVNVLMLSYVLFVIGGDLPDIDAPSSPIRWFSQALIPLALMFSLWNFEPLVKLFGKLGGWGDVLYLSVLVIGGFAAGYLLKFLKHRGFLHTSTFGVMYAAAVFLWLRFSLNFGGDDLLFPTLSAFFGVYTHLLLDYKNPIVIIRFFSKRGF